MKKKIEFNHLLYVCGEVAEKIKRLKRVQLVAISRGGLIPGAIISKKLGLPLNVLHMNSNGAVGGVMLPLLGEHIVYIDDMTDRARTAKAVAQYHEHTRPMSDAVWCSVFIDHTSPLMNEDDCNKLGFEGYIFGEVATDWIVMPHEEEELVVEGDKGLFRDNTNKYASHSSVFHGVPGRYRDASN